MSERSLRCVFALGWYTTSMLHFDYKTVDLRQNLLLEASAGTGKTYALERVVAELLLREGVKLEQMVVLTFTHKAASDLAFRIRQHLESCYQQGGQDQKHILGQALRTLPRAHITTFHSFIQRLLQQAPLPLSVSPQLQLDPPLYQELFHLSLQRLFASPMDAEMETLFDDFYSYYQCNTMEEVFERLERGQIASYLTGHGDMELYPGIKEREHLQRLRSLFQAGAAGHDLLKRLGDFPWTSALFNSRTNGSIQILPRQQRGGVSAATCAEFFQRLAHCRGLDPLLDCLEDRYGSEKSRVDGWALAPLLSQDVLLRGKNEEDVLVRWAEYERVTTIDELLGLLGPIAENTLGRRILGTSEFLRRLREQVMPLLRHRSHEAGVCNLDSLIDVLYQRTCGQDADPRLIGWLRKQYRVALIDEFQDTDRRQWAIIQALFQDPPGDLPPDGRHNMILVGDPKQSIYGFRGVNPYTYAQASGQMDTRYALPVNYRSSNALIEGCNQLFSRLWAAGGDQGLAKFQAVEASGLHNRRLCFQQTAEAPVEWLDCSLSEDQPTNMENVRTTLLMGIRSQVARLLQSDYQWLDDGGTRSPVRPGDIAVLLDTNNMCTQLRKLLAEWGIPAIVSRLESVFDTMEAEVLELWLSLVLAPREQGRASLLLLSPFFSVAPQQLPFFDPEMLEPMVLRQCSLWRSLIDNKNLPLAYQQFCSWGKELTRILPEDAPAELVHDLAEDIPSRLLRNSHGQRHVADLQQLFEWLQYQQFQHGLDAAGLLHALRDAKKRQDNKELQQRLEFDYHTVKLLTAHSSKGLQFPLVFAALGYRAAPPYRRDTACIYHRQTKRIIDLSSSPMAREAEQQEASAELRRLFYVGLTRAQFKLYLPYSLTPKARTHALGLLCDLFPPHSRPADWQPGQGLMYHQLVGKMEPDVLKDLRADINQLCTASPSVFRHQTSTLTDKTPGLSLGVQEEGWKPARRATRDLAAEQSPGHSSFTSLTRGVYNESTEVSEDEDDDVLLAEDESNEAPFDRDTLSGGAELGDLLHVVLEQLNFASADCPHSVFCQHAEVRTLLDRETTRRFNPLWQQRAQLVLPDILWHTLNTPLPPTGLRLCQLTDSQKKHELEFLLNIPQAGQTLKLGHFAQQLRPGALHGFIDLCFRWEGKYYLLDWKSNRAQRNTLGKADWGKEAMQQLMDHHQYPLQYHLYLAALWRRMGSGERGYQRDFGGCYYLFLRGLDASIPGQGVFFHRPSWPQLTEFAAPFGDPAPEDSAGGSNG